MSRIELIALHDQLCDEYAQTEAQETYEQIALIELLLAGWANE